jgi:hypothetical protein
MLYIADGRSVLTVARMGLQWMILAKNAIEVLFFTGLIGCAVVVLFSWVSIFRSGFSDQNED